MRIDACATSQQPAANEKGKRAAAGALIGFFAGAAIGGIAAYSLVEKDCDGCVATPTIIIGASAAGGVLGAIIGGALGAAGPRKPAKSVSRAR